jgi:hypothetical protein
MDNKGNGGTALFEEQNGIIYCQSIFLFDSKKIDRLELYEIKFQAYMVIFLEFPGKKTHRKILISTHCGFHSSI